MKFNININQKATIENFTNQLDLSDMAVYSYCRDIISSPSKSLKRIVVNEQIYTWINYNHLIREMPLLRLKSKRSLLRRLNTLVKTGLLEKELILKYEN